MDKSVDYIIVGDGFAALFFAHELIKNNKNFQIFSNSNLTSSRVAAGIINPLVLKRFTSFWMARQQINHLQIKLAEMKLYLKQDFFVSNPIARIIHDENEKKTWLKKSKREDLGLFLNPNFVELNFVNNPLGSGVVLESGRLNVALFFNTFFDYLTQKNNVVYENFNHLEIDLKNKKYKNLNFSSIVFCEGLSVLHNPFFPKLPIYPNKGHFLNINLEQILNQNYLIKKKHFLFPIQSQPSMYYYGGTYDRDNFSEACDQEAVNELKKGLEEIIQSPYEINHVGFGFRPSVIDRRPLLGKHPEFSYMYLFNGLGSRGVLNASFFAEQLYDFIEFKKELTPEIDFRRLL